MVEAGLIHIPFLLLLPSSLFPDTIATVLIGGLCAFVLAYLLTFAVKTVSYKLNWLDRPAPRRIHKKPVLRLGGIAMFLAFVIIALLFYAPGANSNPTEISIFWLLLAASTLIVGVHVYDDVKGLKPLPKFIAQTIAALIVMGPWIPTFRGVLLYYFSNPFDHLHLPWFKEPNIYLFMTHADFSFVAIPAV